MHNSCTTVAILLIFPHWRYSDRGNWTRCTASQPDSFHHPQPGLCFERTKYPFLNKEKRRRKRFCDVASTISHPAAAISIPESRSFDRRFPIGKVKVWARTLAQRIDPGFVCLSETVQWGEQWRPDGWHLNEVAFKFWQYVQRELRLAPCIKLINIDSVKDTTCVHSCINPEKLCRPYIPRSLQQTHRPAANAHL